MQENVEALGQVLLVLSHGARDIHQAEHHGVGLGLRLRLEAVVADVHRIDVGDQAPAALQIEQRGFALEQAALIDGTGVVQRAQGVELLAQRIDIAEDRAPEGQAAAIGVAHGAQNVEVAGRAGGGVAGAPGLEGSHVLQAGLYQIGQLQILEEEIEKLFARKVEGEVVFALALVAGVLATGAGAAGRPGDAITGRELLVSGIGAFALAAARFHAEARLANALGGNRDLLVGPDIVDRTVLKRLVDGFLDLGPGAAQETLAIAKALVLGVQPPINEMPHPYPTDKTSPGLLAFRSNPPC